MTKTEPILMDDLAVARAQENAAVALQSLGDLVRDYEHGGSVQGHQFLAEGQVLGNSVDTLSTALTQAESGRAFWKAEHTELAVRSRTDEPLGEEFRHELGRLIAGSLGALMEVEPAGLWSNTDALLTDLMTFLEARL